ncbi:hypothetical protein AAZX31_11G082500 [Glycine max]|nr:hypothetical protein JHK86_030521 [Glycine max]KAG5123687.1 hypothetical protein JHK82_030424 [Glycine max]KAH1224105.1 hypothetical protein GmHk_11G031407 [Glycine max]
MASVFVHAERSKPPRHSFRVSRLKMNQRTTLLPGDVFKFSIRVRLNTTPDPTLLLYSPSQTVPCHSFLQEGQLLKTMLSRIHFFIDSIEEVTEGVISCVQELFQVDDVASTLPLEFQHGEIPLWFEMTIFDAALLAVIEESKPCFGTIPASEEAIHTSMEECTDIEESEWCPICMEELDLINCECS